jgi:hypothetical protein
VISKCNKLGFKWEKWYGNKYQQGHRAKEYTDSRKKETSEFLAMYLQANICKMIDIGGGSGESIPDIMPSSLEKLRETNEYVLDISNV